MDSSYDLRSALADALPAAGPSRATVKAMDDVGFKSDPKNNDMKQLFVCLDLASTSGANPGGEGTALGDDGLLTMGAGSGIAAPSASQTLLDYRREKKAAQEAAEAETAKRLAAGSGKEFDKKISLSSSPARGVGLARAAGVGGQELDEAASDERHLRKVNQSRTAAKMSTKQKRRIKSGKQHGTSYEEKYEGKVMNKTKRKGRMAAMKQMY